MRLLRLISVVLSRAIQANYYSLEADDLRKSKVPIGQQKLLLRCVAEQLAKSDTGDSTRDEAPAQPAPIEAPPARVENAAPSTSAGAVDGSGGEDAFVRQLREQGGSTPRTLNYRVCCRGRIHRFT